MVLIFSGDANQSGQVRREVERAIGKGLIVLPFRVEDVNPAGAMEFALGNTHWLDGFTPPVEQHMKLLAQSVNSLLGKAHTTPHRTSDPDPTARARPLKVSLAKRSRMLIAGGFAILPLVVVAGLFAMFRDKPVAPIAETAPVRDKPVPRIAEVPPRQSDQDRIQGLWHPVAAIDAGNTAASTKKTVLHSTPDWEFNGGHLTMYLTGSEKQFRGTFKLSGESGLKSFDFVGTNANEKPVEFVGIYEFEGEFLKICWRTRLHLEDAKITRPNSFAVRPGSAVKYRKFRRLGRTDEKGKLER